MEYKWLSWCGVPLVNHSISTARISCLLFAKRWKWRARRAGDLCALLPMSSLFHDVGKAEDHYVAHAMTSCEKGEAPSFYAHEIFSAAAVSFLANKLLPKRYGVGGKYVLVSSILMHHHGMEDRYSKGLKNVLYLALRGESSEIHDLVNEIENLKGSIRAISVLYKYLKIDFLPECSELLKEEWMMEDGDFDEYSITIHDALKELFGLLDNASGLAMHHKVTATVLTSFVSIADSLSALFERNNAFREKPVDVLKRNSKRYAIRVLREMFSGRKLEETVGKIREIVANPIPITGRPGE